MAKKKKKNDIASYYCKCSRIVEYEDHGYVGAGKEAGKRLVICLKCRNMRILSNEEEDLWCI